LLRCRRASGSAGFTLQHVEMPLGQVLYESAATLSHVYFPTTSIVSLLYVHGERRIGRDRRGRQRRHRRHLALHGRRVTPSRAVVQSAGQGSA
jgi:hypothetical protein